MTLPPRSVHLEHCTSESLHFFGRTDELALLDRALAGGEPSVVAFIGPGGQGKTAIVQHWLRPFVTGARQADGVFLWSFYRGKDADVCLRQLYGYAEGIGGAPEVSASYCVDHLLPRLCRERWVLVLDGAEVVQHDSGPWFGRFLHPELGRLVEELASAPLPGVVVLTSRFPVPTIERRRHAHAVMLGGLDAASACALLASVGVTGTTAELEEAASSCGWHAKAVELLGTYLARFHGGDARRQRDVPPLPPLEGASDEEQHVLRVLRALHAALSMEEKDMVALATAFRQPPGEEQLRAYLASAPVQAMLQQHWQRPYVPFDRRPSGWLAAQLHGLVQLRLLERVGQGGDVVIDAHPLVRRGFEHLLGPGGQRQSAQARAGFLRGRPDRRPPTTLEQAREEVELFHAYCDAGLWNEADSVFVALDNPKHRFLAPVFEHELLLRFFPGGDWRQPPLWPGFGRYRSLAICSELMGDYEAALALYRGDDGALRGDALIALGRLAPLLEQTHVVPAWQSLWQAYRAHALCLAGRTDEAVALARSLVPVDVYEWVHVFECLLRAGQLAALDMRSVLYRPPLATEHRWSSLARQRMQMDYLRLTDPDRAAQLGPQFDELLEAYDRGGLAYERALVRLSYGRWLLARGEVGRARSVNGVTLELAARHDMRIVAADAAELAADLGRSAHPGEVRGRAPGQSRNSRP